MKMMRFAVLALAIVMIASTMMFGVSAADKVEGKKTTTAYIGEVTVDGQIDEIWSHAAVVTDVTMRAASNWYGNPNKVAGTDYIGNIEYRVLWDGESTLYWLLTAYDPELSNNDGVWCNFSGYRLKVRIETGEQYGATHCYPDPSVYLDYATSADGNNVVIEGSFDLRGETGYILADFSWSDAADNVAMTWSTFDVDPTANNSQYGQIELSSTKAIPDQGGDDAGEGEGAPETADFGLTVAIVAAAAGAVVIGTKKRAR